jgi:CubicO group peptidase (beta-lactamase class C family)
MRQFQLPLILFSVIACAARLAALEKAPDVADVSATLQPIIAKAGIPGMAALVLRGDTIVAQGAAGVRAEGKPERVTVDDEFQLCSCTKAMTATLVAELIDQGRLRWDTTLPELFGDGMKLDPTWRTATVRMVLSHRAGFGEDNAHLLRILTTFLFRHGSLADQRRRCAAKVLSHPPDYTPGSKYQYSNMGYIVLGAAIEQLTGKSWEDLMRERLFQPLGMTTTGFGPPGTPGQRDQPWGHGARRLLYAQLPGRGHAYDPGSRNADYPLIYGPAGTVHASLPDWAKFIAVHLRSDPSNPHRQVSVLQPETFSKLHNLESGETVFATGWIVTTRPWANGGRPGDTGRVLVHEGDNGRWNCAVWLAPEIDLAVLVACNRDRVWRDTNIAVGALVRQFAPKPPQLPGAVLDSPTTVSVASGDAITLTVQGNERWHDTKIRLRAGQTISISASGSVYVGNLGTLFGALAADNQGPAGAPSVKVSHARNVAPHLPAWSLVGKVDAQGVPFPVGAGAAYTADHSGELYLSVNDDYFEDNTGSWTVKISGLGLDQRPQLRR